MGKDRDIVDEIFAQLRAAIPDLPDATLQGAALRIRQDWGGARAYVKKAPAEGKAFRLGTALAVGVPLAQAYELVGIGERYGRDLLKRRWKIR